MKKLIILLVAVTITAADFAQTPTKEKVKTHRHKGSQLQYSCPMHPGMVMDKPGKCSECGMNLVASKKEQMKIYTCPMHPDATSDKAGKCSKCGMDLVEVKTKTKKG